MQLAPSTPDADASAFPGLVGNVAGNVQALETTIDALQGLTEEHRAIVEQARTLARLMDYDSTDSKLHGEYRQTLKTLLEVGRKRDVDAFERVLRELKGEVESDG